MNTLKKFSMGVVMGVLALTATTTSANAAGFGVNLPELSTVMAEISKTIAADVTAQLRNALKAPRATRVRRPPSVRVIETRGGGGRSESLAAAR